MRGPVPSKKESTKMDKKISRREFFLTETLGALFEKIQKNASSEKENREERLKQYFESPLHSYPLLQEMPWDMLADEAKARGIQIEGRSKNDIARELFLKADDV